MRNPAAQSAAADMTAVAPIVVAVPLRCPPDRAFIYFTRDIAKWWPLGRYSVGRDSAASVAFEERAGGRIFETDRSGKETVWGHVSEWSPPGRLRFSWHPGQDESTAQWVEVTFVPTQTGTLATLTHGGWEALGERAEATRASYAGGWPTVMGVAFPAYAEQPH